jgi:hypothetical protein
MSLYILILGIMIGMPVTAFAQFEDRGEYVEVSKGARLCSNNSLDISSAFLDPETRFNRTG